MACHFFIYSSSNIVLRWNSAVHKRALKSIGVPAWSFPAQFWAAPAACASGKGASAKKKKNVQLGGLGLIKANLARRQACGASSQEGAKIIVKTCVLKKSAKLIIKTDVLYKKTSNVDERGPNFPYPSWP